MHLHTISQVVVQDQQAMSQAAQADESAQTTADQPSDDGEQQVP